MNLSLVSIFRVLLFISLLWGGLVYSQTPTYTVGGTVSGLAPGNTFVLRNNSSSIIVSSNGVFAFPSQSQGSNWSVSVGIQPTGQICTVANASGSKISSKVTSVVVTCVNAYSVGGSIAGLSASGLVLRLNKLSDIIVPKDATKFKFSTNLVNGAVYSVSVAIQPAGYVCKVTNGSGAISGSNINNVLVDCALGFTVGGSITGLNASGLVIKLNNKVSKIIPNGAISFSFSTLLSPGMAYQVVVINQPVNKYCYVINYRGVVGTASVNDISVICVDTVSITYQTTGLKPGGNVSLQLRLLPPLLQSDAYLPALNNGGTETVQISNNAGGYLTLKAPKEFSYEFIVTSPYGQICLVTPSSGVVNQTLNASVTCSDLPFLTVPVQVTNIPEGMGEVVVSNTTSRGIETCSVTVPTGNACVFGPYDTNETYSVQITQQPISQNCQVNLPSSGVLTGNVTLPIKCEVRQFRISGFVRGNLDPLVITNNGQDSQTIPTDGGYYEFSLQDYLSTWNVEIANASTGQSCYVFNHAGTLTANYPNVNVNCTDSHVIGGTLSGLNAGSTLKLTKTVSHNQQSIFNTEAGAELSLIGAVSDSPGSQVTVGWAFSLNNNKTVSHLGAWMGGNIYGDVAVGLWNGTGNLLASVALTESNFSALQMEGDFGYMSLASNINLLAGEQYTLGAYYTGGIVMAYSSVISPLNGLNFISPSLVNLDVVGLAEPTETFSSSMPLGFFGPNLRFTEPEYGDEVEEITLTADGIFSFPTEVADGDGYSISIGGQPIGQTCTVQNGSGVINTADVYVSVTCGNDTNYMVSTLAGSGGLGNVDATGVAASFADPTGLAVDSVGNVYVADWRNNSIRKISAAGVVTTLAGSINYGFADGTGASASFNSPRGVAVDSGGNVYVADTGNNRIRKITSAGVVTTLAGSGVGGYADGTGTEASFLGPLGVAVDSEGNVYVADTGNNRIRKISPDAVVTTLAGSGNYGYADGIGIAASFDTPWSVSVDSAGMVYVADPGNQRIRKITSAGVVTTLAGSGVGGYADGTGTEASFTRPRTVAVDSSGTVYVFSNSRLRKITTTGVVTTLAGSGNWGCTDGIGTEASFEDIWGLAVDSAGKLYIADTLCNRIRKLTPMSNTSAVGGSVTGLTGSVTLTNNGGDPRTVSTDGGTFTFSPQLNGLIYNVAVSAQPNGQTCQVFNGSGTLTGANVTNVSVMCAIATTGVSGLSFSSNQVLFSGGQETIQLNIEFGDDGRSYSTAGIHFYGPNDYSRLFFTGIPIVNRRAVVSIPLNKWTAQGYWRIAEVSSYDTSGNFAVEYENALASKSLNTRLQVYNSIGDNVRPTLNSLNVSQDHNYSGQFEDIIVRVGFSDNNSGLNSIGIQIGPRGGSHKYWGSIPAESVSQGVALFRISSAILQNFGIDTSNKQADGDWQVLEVNSYDNAGNFRVYYSNELESLGYVSTYQLRTTGSFSVSGTVSGLGSGKSVVLQNNGANNQTVTYPATGFSFPAESNDSTYNVTVLTQPVGQTCFVLNGSGVVTSAISNVSIVCSFNTSMSVLLSADSSISGLEPSIGQRKIRLAPFSNGRVAVIYSRGYPINCPLFGSSSCTEQSTTWHMVVDQTGLVTSPQRTWSELDSNQSMNTGSIFPAQGRAFGDGSSVVFAMAHSSHNSLGGNFVKITSDGSVLSRLGGTGSYSTESCVIGTNIILSSLYVDPVSNGMQWWANGVTPSSWVNFGGYGYNYSALQSLGCGTSQALGGGYGIIVRKRPSVGAGFTLYSAPGSNWTQIGTEVILPSVSSDSGDIMWGGGLDTGDDTGVIMFRNKGADGRLNMYYARFRITSSGIQLVDTAPKAVFTSVSYEGLDGAVTYGGSGKYYLTTFHAGNSANGQPVNTKQSVRAFSLDFTSGELTSLGQSFEDNNWSRSPVLDFYGNSANVESFSAVKSCDGNLYIGGAVDGGTGRSVLKIFKVTNISGSVSSCNAGG